MCREKDYGPKKQKKIRGKRKVKISQGGKKDICKACMRGGHKERLNHIMEKKSSADQTTGGAGGGGGGGKGGKRGRRGGIEKKREPRLLKWDQQFKLSHRSAPISQKIGGGGVE